MKLKSILQIVAFLVFASTAIAADKSVLFVEIRCPKGIEIGSTNDVYSGFFVFATDFKISGTPFNLSKQREDGEFKVFEHSYNLLSRDHRRAIIVIPWNHEDQVFQLPVPRKLKPIDWTNWQRANYVETNAISNFRFDYKPADRSTNIPPNSFELRYKIE
jgi:hypothetical protein